MPIKDTRKFHRLWVEAPRECEALKIFLISWVPLKMAMGSSWRDDTEKWTFLGAGVVTQESGHIRMLGSVLFCQHRHSFPFALSFRTTKFFKVNSIYCILLNNVLETFAFKLRDSILTRKFSVNGAARPSLTGSEKGRWRRRAGGGKCETTVCEKTWVHVTEAAVRDDLLL